MNRHALNFWCLRIFTSVATFCLEENSHQFQSQKYICQSVKSHLKISMHITHLVEMEKVHLRNDGYF